MSCHTTVFKKMSALPEEDVQEMFLQASDYVNKKYDNYNDSSWIKSHREKLKKIYNWSDEDLDVLLKNTRKKLKETKKHSKDIYKFIYMSELFLVVSHKGEYYVELTWDYPFRLYKDTDKVFTDKKELIDFLCLAENQEHLFYEDERCKDKNCKGCTPRLIEMLDEFFAEHGENNLYFEFG